MIRKPANLRITQAPFAGTDGEDNPDGYMHHTNSLGGFVMAQTVWLPRFPMAALPVLGEFSQPNWLFGLQRIEENP